MNLNSNMFGRRFTGFDLKLIALITMLIDHIGAIFVWRLLVAANAANRALGAGIDLGPFAELLLWVEANEVVIFTIYQIMRYIGRMAFPIYCFLLVEGFLHTRNVGKYALRLGVFALISEVPFDLALRGTVWAPTYNNVFFTLVIGLLLIWGVSYVEKFHEFWQEKQYDGFIGTVAALAIGGTMTAVAVVLVEKVLSTDYGMGGVLAILVLYLFRKNVYIAYTLAILILVVLSGKTEILALLMLYPISHYDGSRGKNMKYIFYAFYPVHLLLLALLCMALGV